MSRDALNQATASSRSGSLALLSARSLLSRVRSLAKAAAVRWICPDGVLQRDQYWMLETRSPRSPVRRFTLWRTRVATPLASSTRCTPTGSTTPSASASSHCVVKSSYSICLAIAIAFGSSRIIRSSSFAYSSISCVFYFGGSHSNTCQAFANSGLNCINNVEISITSQEPSTESSITPTQSNHVSR